MVSDSKEVRMIVNAIRPLQLCYKSPIHRGEREASVEEQPTRNHLSLLIFDLFLLQETPHTISTIACLLAIILGERASRYL